MAVKKNVAKGEGFLRIVAGVVLFFLGWFLAGFWRPLFIVAGLFLVATAFVGY